MTRKFLYSMLAGRVGDIVAYVLVLAFGLVVVTLLGLMPLLPIVWLVER